ncbi:Phosphatidylinositide phosphatase SAC1 [Bonamia ostreae]
MAKSAKEVGHVYGKKVFKIVLFEIVPVKLHNQSKSDEKEDYICYELIEKALKTRELLFCEHFDLSKTTQSIFVEKDQNKRSDFFIPELDKQNYELSDLQFIWNGHILKEFIEKKAFQFVQPVINGYVGNFEDANENLFTIISRRSVRRDGMRLLSRGIDEKGNVSNFVETETILQRDVEPKNDELVTMNFVSFVCCRGSIPLFWKQKQDLSRKPAILLNKDKNKNLKAFRAHIENLKSYGDLVLVNLVDSSGREKVLGEEYLDVVDRYNSELDGKEGFGRKVEYIGFDFHLECDKLGIANAKKLLQQIERRFDEMCFEGKVSIINEKVITETIKTQKCTCRINCMDNLDRTNLVQSLITTNFFKNLNSEKLARIWVNNGDCLSRQYSGTNALKSDWTKTGRRSFIGLLNDGRNSLNRYRKKTFEDAPISDGLNIFLGKFSPSQNRLRVYKQKFNFYVGAFVFAFSFLVLEYLSSLKNGKNGISRIGSVLVSVGISVYVGFKLRISRMMTETDE